MELTVEDTALMESIATLLRCCIVQQMTSVSLAPSELRQMSLYHKRAQNVPAKPSHAQYIPSHAQYINAVRYMFSGTRSFPPHRWICQLA